MFATTALNCKLFCIYQLDLGIIGGPVMSANCLARARLNVVNSTLFFSCTVKGFIGNFLTSEMGIHCLVTNKLLVTALMGTTLKFTMPF